MTMIAANAANAYAQAAKMIAPGAGGEAGAAESAKDLPKFADLVQGMLGDAVKAGRQAEATSAASLTGQAELIDVVTAISAAETTLETVISIRDRVISAYQEISRMPI